MLDNYLPILVLLAVVGGLCTALLVLARLLGPSKPSKIKDIPYESGLDPESTPQMKFNVQFYRVALLFLVFDIEAAFFYPWAVLFRRLSCHGTIDAGKCQGDLSFFGFGVMAVFVTLLLLAFVYVWNRKALEWE